MGLSGLRCVVIIQFSKDVASRTYYQYDSLQDALHAMCLIYEQSMKTANPHMTKVVYDLTDLRRFIDSLDDVLFFVQQDGPLFQARGRQWIKEAMYTTLKRESKPQGR
ncbi:MAG: hypothetical protein KVP17_002566 [Porospora cf. gigantea B]|uniref:uncharacterized protein n=1 Tax=Porospora cf. gigantea B TaxID=2853592 RepID=UPI003571A763|nr:MAG: hypothetical protein KVP17_002566 [Porospora cf. gigantea B]